ncbi:SIS domain protein [Mycobacterium kansasii]|uniref:SIS domain protein n=3 Tax=Mycobacterium kansasii TaxID=1768 RepID=A0A1V3X7Z3_MYCKA|nr:SIS domain protein [Mycobacterium kansasii]
MRCGMRWAGPARRRLRRCGRQLAAVLNGGGRLLACGNGGSAAEAQHLTAELVGRFRDERIPLSAIALHADTSAVTAVANGYGEEEMFARGLRAHAKRRRRTGGSERWETARRRGSETDV